MTRRRHLLGWFAALFAAGNARGGSAGADPTPDLLNMIFASDGLIGHFHFDSMPNRLPLKLVNATGQPLPSEGVVAGGRPVEWLSSPSPEALTLTSVSVGGGEATVSFDYPPEGLRGTAEFRKAAGAWSISDLDLREH